MNAPLGRGNGALKTTTSPDKDSMPQRTKDVSHEQRRASSSSSMISSRIEQRERSQPPTATSSAKLSAPLPTTCRITAR